MEVTTLKTWLCIIVLMPLAVLAQPNDKKTDKFGKFTLEAKI